MMITPATISQDVENIFQGINTKIKTKKSFLGGYLIFRDFI